MLRFDATLPHQAAAVAAVVDLFAGLPRAPHPAFTETGVANPPGPGFAARLPANLRAVQERHGLPPTGGRTRDFAVEMETGTGKTYVYLRTAFELHRAHGFRKFVVVVPSVAVREGVLASIEALREHLTALYAEPFDAVAYDARRLGRVRRFATSGSVQFLVMTLQAFRRDVAGRGGNVVHRAQDQMAGRRPIEVVASTRPVVILDEPQNMESDGAAAAIAKLNPFCTLRYSATHRNPHQLVYRLDPVEAREQGLVKGIEVASVVPDGRASEPLVRLLAVDAGRSRARLTIHHEQRERTLWVRLGDDLAPLSAGRREYARGFVVADIGFREPAVRFSGGLVVTPSTPAGTYDAGVRRAQVIETVRRHLDRERALAPRGVKVLSLFFVDRVASYRAPDGGLGEAGRWFEEAYTRLGPGYPELDLPPVGAAHGGYFAGDPRTGYVDGGETDASAFDLIMRDRERLLSAAEPMRFLFSHSALREGWDNPNVFQICTLNETRSPDRKRQEIGRGLRLPVDAAGRRVRDPRVARLTVVANEAYDEFARTLQEEYRADTGREIVVRRAGDPDAVVRGAAFAALWARVGLGLRARLPLSTEDLVRHAVRALRAAGPITSPLVRVRTTDHATGESMAGPAYALEPGAGLTEAEVVAEVQARTGLTRATVCRVLGDAGLLGCVGVNPTAVLDRTASALLSGLRAQLPPVLEIVGGELRSADGARGEPVVLPRAFTVDTPFGPVAPRAAHVDGEAVYLLTGPGRTSR
ncbi:DEAD/DEAH box helicase family protein [Pseudonocardia halophobica]|uniref:DEAD/DEAH box helicase family protein n=1 Tax=Pseudonocardia halophobica TaxID=29401 RepID=UPI003D8A3E28